MKQKIVLPRAIKWARGKGKNFALYCMGVKVDNIHGEKIRIALRDGRCMFPGCDKRLTHFNLTSDEDVTHAKPVPMSNGHILTYDHKVAQCLGGKNEPENIWLMCYNHNQEKAKRETWLFNVLQGKKP